MATSKKEDKIVKLLSEYYHQQCNNDEKSQDVESFAKYLESTFTDPIAKVRKLMRVLNSSSLDKNCTIEILPLCMTAVTADLHQFQYTKENMKIFYMEKRISDGLDRIIENLETLKKLSGSEDILQPLRQSVYEKTKNRLREVKEYFHKRALGPHISLKRSEEMRKKERPSGQVKAYLRTFTKAVKEIKNILAAGFAQQSKGPLKPWRGQGKGFEAPAAQLTYEILLCFDIDMKSGDNVRKILFYE